MPSLPTPPATLTSSTPLGELAACWLADFTAQVGHNDRSKTTRSNYLQALNHFGPLLSVPLAQLTAPAIFQWHREIYARTTSAVAYGAYTALRALCGWCRCQGLLPYNPAAGLRIRHQRRATDPIKPDQYIALQAATFELLDERVAWAARRRNATALTSLAYLSAVLALLLTALTGRRPGEVCELRCDAVDLTTGTITIRNSKTGPSVVVLGPEGAALVRERIEALGGRSEYLFPSPARLGHPVTRHAVWDLFHTATKRAGISNKQLRGLRTGWAFAALVSGVGLEDTGRALGHRDLKTTQRAYGHGVYVTPGMIRAAETVEFVRRRRAA